MASEPNAVGCEGIASAHRPSLDQRRSDSEPEIEHPNYSAAAGTLAESTGIRAGRLANARRTGFIEEQDGLHPDHIADALAKNLPIDGWPRTVIHEIMGHVGFADADVQRVLGRTNHKPGVLRCWGCTVAGRRGRVVSREINSGYSPVRWREYEHDKFCCLMSFRDGVEPQTPGFDESTFASWPSRRRVHSHVEGAGLTVGNPTDEFGEYARCLIARAGNSLASQFVKLGRRVRNPSASEFLHQIHQEIQAYRPFGKDGYTAANLAGYRLRFGLVYSKLEHLSVTDGIFTAWWWDGGLMQMQLVRAGRRAIQQALHGVSVYKKVQSAPYLLFASQSLADGQLARIYLQQVLVRPSCLVPVESDIEAVFASRNLERAYVMPVVRVTEANRLLKDYFPQTAEDLPFRPDFLLLTKIDCEFRAEIVEVAGFKPGAKKEYDDLMDRKVPEFRQLSVRSGLKFTLEPGHEYEDKLPAVEKPYLWPSMRILHLAPTSVVVDFVHRLAETDATTLPT